MKRYVYATVAVLLAGFGGGALYKLWRYRQDAQTWHARWLALHRNPAGRDQYARDNQRLRAQGTVPHRVVFLGASITERLDFTTLFPGQPFVNRGAGGQLVWQQYLRLDPDALDLSPESVVIKMCAINLLPDAPPLEETQYYYAAMADAIRRRGAKAVLATTVPVTRGYEAGEGGNITPLVVRFNEWVRDQAHAHHDTLLDYASALSDSDGYLPDDLAEPDGLHPNRAGMTRMAATIRAVLVEGRGQPAVPVAEPVPPGPPAGPAEGSR